MKHSLIRVTISILLAAILGLPLAIVAFGSDFTGQSNGTYPFASMAIIQDDFLSGGTTNGTIGLMGWNAAGTVTRVASESGRPGIYRIDTGAVSGVTSSINWFNSSGINAGDTYRVLFIVRVNTNDANTTIRLGGQNSVTASPPANGIYFEKLDADTNWFCVTRSGGVQTRNDTGVAVSTSFVRMFYTKITGSVTFGIGSNLNACTNTTNITGTSNSPAVQITNSAAASKTIDIDYFEAAITGLAR